MQDEIIDLFKKHGTDLPLITIDAICEKLNCKIIIENPKYEIEFTAQSPNYKKIIKYVKISPTTIQIDNSEFNIQYTTEINDSELEKLSGLIRTHTKNIMLNQIEIISASDLNTKIILIKNKNDYISHIIERDLYLLPIATNSLNMKIRKCARKNYTVMNTNCNYYKKCKQYIGFPRNIDTVITKINPNSDFFKQNIGFYTVYDINTKNQIIKSVYGIKEILSSPEILFLIDNKVEFRVTTGLCSSNKPIDIDLQKIENVNNFDKFTWINSLDKENQKQKIIINNNNDLQKLKIKPKGYLTHVKRYFLAYDMILKIQKHIKTNK